MKLVNKVVVITGASSGIGRATALLFAKEGAKVVAVARRKDRLVELSESAKDSPGSIFPYEADVAKRQEVEDMIDYVIREFGQLDVLYNNAGIMDEMLPMAEVTDEIFENVMHVNVYGPMYAMRKALDHMLKQGGGVIINTASLAGVRGTRAGAAYTASKHAVVGMTKNTAYMYGDQNIRCNAICPGGVNTEVGIHMQNPSKFGLSKATSGISSVSRTAEAIEIANIALFLASDDSSFVNGVALIADGGWAAY